jgi:CelD/BcsL family acetyltransferase involved in cellulose biosynthesis
VGGGAAQPAWPRLVSPLRVERLPGLDSLAAVAREWDELDAELVPRTPFTSPLWNVLWWKHHRSARLFVRDELFVHVVRDQRGRLLAVAPMMLTRRPALGPLQLRVVQCFGADVNVTELRGLVCRPQHWAAVMEALTAHFAGSDTTCDWIDWGTVRDDDGAAGPALARAGAIGWEQQTPCYYLPLPASWSDFRARLHRNIKESLRKCYNSLARDRHAFSLRVVSDPAQSGEALETFFRLHRERGQLAGTVSHNDVFATQKDRDFLIDYAQQMASRDQLRVFQLVIGGQVVATRLGFLLGDELYLYYSGYDTRWSRYSVMTTVVAEAIKWAIDRRLRVVNLSTGYDVSKLRWAPKAMMFRSALRVSPERRSQRAFNAYHQLVRFGREDSRLAKLVTTIARR